ncbi:MAG: Hsp20/alpha crystallin family protein [Patescibacteria group bacterium]
MASFFEKLTGSVSIEKAQESGVFIEPTIEGAETESNYEAESVASRGAVVSRGKEKKEWAALQTEGQLTVDIFEKADKIIIQSAVAGTDPNDIDITLTHDMITIKGTRKQAEEVRDDNYFYRELYWGSFSRSVILPEEIDETKADASIKNGILTIKLPKKQTGGQKLKVKTE